ncbi:hypothetical protein AOL_s00007g18 [Orbilia oligospora ATCC 24927]|uniref:Uncharacterized protein n=1 Tax=Arthrobotrys oligospora (strain ATCC 24927 / CBS 115.81 / DSM 1491) TaxID=756982 RepID=G1X159_ARTOA|nr:hypothetical protein AOL_s00007g18 [Orbilia oligospora ATCC 24927]EGX53069.1 hypothetical protein AOL_s00007g18 [Orbilia oligospora ATCC 24927]
MASASPCKSRNPIALGNFFCFLALTATAFLSLPTLASTNNFDLANKALSLDATITAAPDPSLVNLRLYPRQTATGSTGLGTSATPEGRDACSALYSVYSWCSTSGFTNLAGTSALASCACYYNKSYVPQIFDGLATSCYDYIRSIRPEATEGVAQYLNVCYLAGDISKSATIGSLACNTLASVLNSCGARTPKSSDYVFSGSSSLADCACYNSRTKFAPDGFDHLASACYTYAQNQAGQGDQISTLLDFCGTVGDVRLSASQALKQCQLFDDQYGACESAYSGGKFGTLTASLQASCLCYGARASWVPGIIDGAAKTCVGYLSTANPARAKSLVAYADGFCEGFGNLRSSTSTSAEPEITTTLPPSTIATSINSSTTESVSTAAPSRTQSTESSEASSGTSIGTSLPIPTGTGLGVNAGPCLTTSSLYILTAVILSILTTLFADL